MKFQEIAFKGRRIRRKHWKPGDKIQVSDSVSNLGSEGFRNFFGDYIISWHGGVPYKLGFDDIFADDWEYVEVCKCCEREL